MQNALNCTKLQHRPYHLMHFALRSLVCCSLM
nr:MAG TPA: hypothetical protein [Caudoviricetes sp.]